MSLWRALHIILLMTVGFGADSITLRGQSPFDPSFTPEAFLIREHLELFADRSIYVVDESIQFRADHRVDGVGEGVWSTVLYAELVTSTGKSVADGKFTLSEGMGSGSLKIPGGALTGNYFLKCYTRWMRNSGPQSFSYTPLKIVNPFDSKVTDHGNGTAMEQTITRREYTTGYLNCSTQKPVYGKGEEVRLSLTGPLMNRLQQINCCVTVVPSGAVDMDHGQVTFAGSSMKPGDYKVNYLPDLKGASLTGTVVSADQWEQPIQSARLYFSLLGENPDYFATVTDDMGRFVISTTNRTGIQELFVTPDPSVAGEVEVRIDQDFDTGKMPVPAKKFGLSAREHEVATQMALQMQLSELYESQGSGQGPSPDATDREEPLFYGTPGFSIMMDDFVTLPTLEEVFINLVPGVEVVVKRGKKSLKIYGPNTTINLYQPLIMIDHIPVFDQQLIMGIHPEKILKIDLIREVYVKGNVSHGGVISIFTRNGDMAGIDLSAHSYFFDVQSIQSLDSKEIQVYAPGDRVPDMRNTLFWMEDIFLQKGSTQEVTFRAPSVPGDYVILVRGVAHQGNVISATALFSVE
ncbi:MAG: hypothetical protein ABFS38_05075 [Bacteroidota bacterium]